VNCYLEGASDVPAAGEDPGQPKEQRDPARATAKVAAPQKGRPAGRTCRRRGGYNRRPHPAWEASDQRRTAKRHSFGSGVCVSGETLGHFGQAETGLPRRNRKCPCQQPLLAVVSDLPIKRLTRATRKGQSALAAEQGSFAAPIIPSSGTCGGNSHRKGITRGKHRPHRIDSENPRELLWGSCAEIGKAAAAPFFRGSWQIARSENSRQFAECPLVIRSQAEGLSVHTRTRRQAKEVQQRDPGRLSAETQCTRQHIARKYTHDDRIDAAPD